MYENARTVLSWAYGATMPMELPESMDTVEARIRLLNDVALHIVPKEQDLKLNRGLTSSNLAIAGRESARYLTDVVDPQIRANIVGRLWSGYIYAAWAIDAVNSETDRKSQFQLIHYLCELDPIFKAGVQAAPELKKRLGEKVSFAGVPRDSPVLDFETS